MNAASQSLILLANHGLFLKKPLDAIHHAEKRVYCIRNASKDDLSRLLLLEKRCWGDLQLTEAAILTRIEAYPNGQWVCTVDGLVVAVMYTQLLNERDDLLSAGVDFSSQSKLHRMDGSILQLLGVAVLQEYSNLQLGLALRDFVLQIASFECAIEVVAMTRCSRSASDFDDYKLRVSRMDDPILQFHRSGGAHVVQIVQNYRPEDITNYGCAVLISYDRLTDNDVSRAAVELTDDVTSSRIEGQESNIDVSMLKDVMIRALGGTEEDFQMIHSMDTSLFLNTPFMDAGLDSMQLISMRSLLVELLEDKHLLRSATLLYDYSTPLKLLEYLSSESKNPGLSPTLKAISSSPSPSSEDVYAICGMSCRMPGSIYTPQAFFDALCGGLDAAGPIPDEWHWANAKSGRCFKAALLNEDLAETFDPSFFGISAAEAQQMDPHQRLILEVAHEALAESCLLRDATKPYNGKEAKIGVFVGLCNSDWSSTQHAIERTVNPFTSTGTASSATANRLSFILGLEGPSMVVDTACSSSLTAVHVALNALRCGDCDAAVVASADLISSPHSLLMRESSNMLSPDGKNRTFDANANGYVRGEGAGAIVLRKLSHVENEDDNLSTIYALVRGSAINQDGRSATFTAPNGLAQRNLLRTALSNSGIDASDLSFIESHGTGTPLGDPIEFGAIGDTLLQQENASPLLIGAVKTNIGHLEGTAGLAGLMKAALALRNKKFPPNLNFSQLNPTIDLSLYSRAVVFPSNGPCNLAPVSDGQASMCSIFGGVSSFGSGGTNVHVVLQSYEAKKWSNTVEDIVSENPQGVGFLFAGQGFVYDSMGKELYYKEEKFRQIIRRCSAAVDLVPSLEDYMYCDRKDSFNLPRERSVTYSQLALFALESALASLWTSQGIKPAVVAGHSIGEYAAAVTFGLFSVEDGCRILLERSLCFENLAKKHQDMGKMVALRLTEEQVQRGINQARENATNNFGVAVIAVQLTKRSVVLSGNTKSVDAVLSALGNPTAKTLDVDFAYHSPIIQEAAEQFYVRLQEMIDSGCVHFFNYEGESGCSSEFVSCLTGASIARTELCDASYWKNQMLGCVRFVDSMNAVAAIQHVNSLVEVGPDQTLTKLVRQCDTRFTSSIPSLQYEQDASVVFGMALDLLTRRMHRNKAGGRHSSSYKPSPFPWRMRMEKRQPIPEPVNSLSRHNLSLQNVLHAVQNAVESVCAIDLDACIDENTCLLSLGIDSLGSLSVRNTLADKFDLPHLDNTLVLKHPSIMSIAKYIADELKMVTARRLTNNISSESLNKKCVNCEIDCTSCSCSTPIGRVNDMDSTDSSSRSALDEIEEFPTTRMQQAIIFHHISESDLKSFMESFTWIVSGQLNVEAFKNAWVELILVHSSLRSSFDPYSLPFPLQKVWDVDRIKHEYMHTSRLHKWFNVKSINDVNTDEELKEAIRSEVFHQRQHSFDITEPLLPRVLVLKCTSGDAVVKTSVLMTIHHLVIDGFSMNILLENLAAAYQRHLYGTARKPHSEIENNFYHSSYAPFATYEHNFDNKKSKKYWKGIVQDVDLPLTHHPLPFVGLPIPTIDVKDEAVSRRSLYLEQSFVEELRDAAKKLRITLASLIHSAWCVLHSYNCDTEVVLYGTTSSGRSARVDGIENIIGPVVNTLPMVVSVLSELTLQDLGNLVQQRMIGLLQHENFPLAEIQKMCHRTSSFFNVIFDFQMSSWDKELDSSTKLGSSMLLDRIGCPLSVRAIVVDDGIQLHATSECSTYNERILEELLISLRKVLSATVQQSSHEKSISTLLRGVPRVHTAMSSYVNSYRPDVNPPSALLHEQISELAKSATKVDEAVACFLQNGSKVSLSYFSLYHIANKVATMLVKDVISLKESKKQSCVIAVVMEKGWEQVAAVVAIHQLQCAYLPMDARLWPEQRIKQVIDMSKSLAIITQKHLFNRDSMQWMHDLDIPVVTVDEDDLSGHHPIEDSDESSLALQRIPRATPDDLAYLIYTSGSTGVPKGVCCHHQGAMNTIDDLNSLFEIGKTDRVLALSSLSFDLSVYDIFGMINCGGTVVIPPPECVSPPDPSEWLDLVISEQVSVWNTVPAFMELLVSHAEFTGKKLPACLRLVFMSGDWIPVNLPNRIRTVSENEDIRIISMGGATEAAIWSNIFEIEKNGSGIPEGWSSIPYGKPMRNQRMYILNSHLEHCAEWVTGGIYIGGVGVAKGYYNNPERTNYQFITHPVTGEKLFRTGDLGRVRPGGLIEILGREDSQVKVNGFRIELGEIEKILTQHAGVQSAALTVHNNVLCAYIVPRSSFTIDSTIEELKELCKIQLTDYMLPRHFLIVEEIPLSSNGKVMRDKLPSPADATSNSGIVDDTIFVPPRTTREAEVQKVFAQILSLPESSICCVHASFFDMGGNSLTSIQLIFAVRDRFGVTLTIQDLFQDSTVERIAEFIEKRSNSTVTSAEVDAEINMKEILLQKGASESSPLILFNPAGASGLCYMELVKALGSDVPVYVMDDDVMMSGGTFTFASIEDVAENCLSLVQKVLKQMKVRSLILGGWSYGGVVATAVAKLLKDSESFSVDGIVLFDSPLRAPRQLHEKPVVPRIVTDHRSADDANSSQNNEFDLEARTSAHFSSCTNLLRMYHEREIEQKPLSCPIIDVRPYETDYDCDLDAIDELTTGSVIRKHVTGTHWTMMFGEHVVEVASVVSSLLSDSQY